MKCGFSDLVLLIGTNPMPPFVVASYFLNNPHQYANLKTIWLLHSEFNTGQHSTLEEAQNIAMVLQARYAIKVNCYPIRDISNARSIQKDVDRLVFQVDSENVHLNYSGGTKAMVIHTYRTLEQSLIKNTSFSYLDGRRFRLINDHTGNSLHDKDLRHHIAMNMEAFLTLHGFEIYSPLKKKIHSSFCEPLAGIGELIDTGKLEEFWGIGKRSGWHYLRQTIMKALSGVYDIKKPKYLKRFKKQLIKILPKYYETLSYFHPHETFNWVLERFDRDLYPFFLPKGTLQVTSDQEYIRLFQMIRFLDGEWLEMHIYKALKEVLSEQSFHHSLARGLELKKKNWNTFFEMDLAALIGYQLIGISCTTHNSKSVSKNKGFEIVHRTRQIGGDEIREILKMILVCYVSEHEKERLQQELSVDTGTSRGNILVLGKEDFKTKRLKEQLKTFIYYTTH